MAPAVSTISPTKSRALYDCENVREYSFGTELGIIPVEVSGGVEADDPVLGGQGARQGEKIAILGALAAVLPNVRQKEERLIAAATAGDTSVRGLSVCVLGALIVNQSHNGLVSSRNVSLSATATPSIAMFGLTVTFSATVASQIDPLSARQWLRLLR